MSVGTRTTLSSAQTIVQQTLDINNVWLGFYIFSAWIFAETCIWSSPTVVRLGWILYSPGSTQEKTKLNERPIFFRCMFIILALGQSLWHVYRDEDEIPMPIRKASAIKTKDGTVVSAVEPPRNQIRRNLPSIAKSATAKASILYGVGFALYFLVIRSVIRKANHAHNSYFDRLHAWNFSFSIARYIFFLHRYTPPTGIYPLFDITSRTLYSTFLLTFLWDFANIAFDAYIAQEPLRKGRPITDASKDPNGSLIRGLDHRLKTAKAYAFWELWLITQRFPDRRKSIYADIDRNPTSWKQVSELCLREIRGVSDRISAFIESQSSASEPKSVSTPGPADTMPLGTHQTQSEKEKIVPPLKTDPILAATPLPKTRTQRAAQLASNLARQQGQSTSPPRPLHEAQRALNYSAKKLLPPSTLKEIEDAPKTVRQKAGGLVMWLVSATWPGSLMRLTFPKRATAVVCGTPTSRTGIIVDAVLSLSKLVTESLREDPYGQVAKDVRSIVTSMMRALKDVRGFMLEGLQPHWTDVGFRESERQTVEEVNYVEDALREGLTSVLGAFGEYAAGVGLSEGELQEAKRLVAVKEMEERKG